MSDQSTSQPDAPIPDWMTRIPGWDDLPVSARNDLAARIKMMREDSLSTGLMASEAFTRARDYIMAHLRGSAKASAPASVVNTDQPSADQPSAVNPSPPVSAPVGQVLKPVSPSVWPHDDTFSLSRFYGDPTKPMPLAKVNVPWTMYYTEDLHHVVRQFSMHVKVVPAMNRILARIWDCCNHNQATVEAAGMHLWGGAYNPRPVRGAPPGRWSTHAFAAAVDWDPDHNEMNTHPSDPHRIPNLVVQCFKDEGAFWGGDFRTRHDPMHFQFAHE